MGNQQGGPTRRDRLESGSHPRHARGYTNDDECPVQVKIAKTGSPSASIPSMQYDECSEYPVVLKWTGASSKHVSVAGSWDGWKKRIPMVKSHDDFTTILNLPEGKHEFKFLVDGAWMCEPNGPKTDNAVGTQNNVLTIDKADFEVFDALDKDLQSTPAGGSELTSGVNQTAGSSSVSDRDMEKSKPYGQEIPERRDFEKAHHPPVLPPHLLQVILNKDTPVSCDPNVLPEPNHVMLNHLYALSIKDGVMVLSATHRYRKKYVTTLLYRPI